MEEEKVINPFTGRAITVGGRTYKFVEAELIEWLEKQCSKPLDPNRPRKYCGNKEVVPEGYERRGTPYECMQKGYKTGVCSVYNKFAKSKAPGATQIYRR